VAKKRAAPPAPEDSLQRYRALLGEGEFTRLLAALAVPLPQALRANPLKVNPAAAIRAWQARYGWQTQPVPFCYAGWQVLEAQTTPSATIEFRLGQYYIQDAASMLPAELFDFAGLDAPLILDMAAAPGGKTTHLISRAGDRGLTLANDSAPGDLPPLRGVLRDGQREVHSWTFPAGPARIAAGETITFRTEVRPPSGAATVAIVFAVSE